MKEVHEIGLSPLPWRWSGACTVSNEHYDAIDGSTWTTRVCFTEMEEDARFIVHTPRLYKELMKALPQIKCLLEIVKGQPFEICKKREDLKMQIASIEEALQLASGEKKGYVGELT